MNNTKTDLPASASPRPWRVTEYGDAPQDIYSADGHRVCTMGITVNADADAALIVRAVNAYADPRIVTDNSRVNADLLADRDRLRDLVRRLAETLGTITAILNYDYERRYGITSESCTSFNGVEFAGVLREAREALGEDAR